MQRSSLVLQAQRSIALVLAALQLGVGQALLGETLGDVLAAHHLPPRILPAEELLQPITSYAASTGEAPFLLAYYIDDGSGLLTGKLHMLRYDPKQRHLQQAAFEGVGDLSSGVMTGLSSECLGSVLSISEADGYIAMNTHINPSAGCLVVFTTDLRFRAALYGWLSARVGQRLLFTESMVHFAPISSERFSLYDPVSEQLTPIYPVPGDPARAAFSAALQAHLPAPEVCAGQNLACVPEDFTVGLGNVTVDTSGTSFSFAANMSAEGFGEEEERLVPARTVRYICTLEGGRWLLKSK